MHTVIETPTFLASVKANGLTPDERFEIVNIAAADPTVGDIMKGTGGARKFRVGGRGKGKSGGYRVVTYYAAEDVPVFVLDVFSKGDKINLSASERNELKEILSTLADDYRKSTKEKVTQLSVRANR